MLLLRQAEEGARGRGGRARARAGGAGDMRPPPRQRSKSIELEPHEEPPAAMTVIVSIQEDGLGLVSWWE